MNPGLSGTRESWDEDDETGPPVDPAEAQAIQEAHEWLAVLGEGITPKVTAAFLDWLLLSPVKLRAFMELIIIGEELARAFEDGRLPSPRRLQN